MASGLRFAVTNLLETLPVVVLNGTGGGAPARDEVSPYVIENAFGNDSTAPLWRQSSGAGTINLDLDLGSDQVFSLFGVLGTQGVPTGATGILSVTPSFRTDVAGYNPAGPWTGITGGAPTIAGLRRGASIFSNVTGRYLRLAIFSVSAWSIGRLFLGRVDYDFAQVASPGRQRFQVFPELRTEVGGSPSITRNGRTYFLYRLTYDRALDALFAKATAIAGQDQPAVMVETDGSVYEVVRSESQFQDDLMFDSPNQRSAYLYLRTIG